MECPNCRTANPEGAKFCLNCGTPLEAARPIEGERKFVTVLFADVVDSTGMGERLDPESLTDQRMIYAQRGKALVYHTAPFEEATEVPVGRGLILLRLLQRLG